MMKHLYLIFILLPIFANGQVANYNHDLKALVNSLDVSLAKGLVANYNNDFQALVDSLEDFKLLDAREIVNRLKSSKLTNDQWLQIRDLIHKNPQVGLDVLLKYDSTSPIKMKKVDLVIQQADKLMMEKKFAEAAKNYQRVLKLITQEKKFTSGRNYHLYWSIVHSLARTFYARKQYNDAHALYRTIPNLYPHYKQIQFELMWNSYMNERLEYSLKAIATIASGHFSKMLEPEVYLLQYYIYRRMCRDEDVDVIKKRVKNYQEVVTSLKVPLSDWIKKDVETLAYQKIMESGDGKGIEAEKLRIYLEAKMDKDVKRFKKDFDLVAAHIALDSGKNKNLKQVKKLLKTDQVFLQKDLCKTEVRK